MSSLNRDNSSPSSSDFFFTTRYLFSLANCPGQNFLYMLNRNRHPCLFLDPRVSHLLLSLMLPVFSSGMTPFIKLRVLPYILTLLNFFFIMKKCWTL